MPQSTKVTGQQGKCAWLLRRRSQPWSFVKPHKLAKCCRTDCCSTTAIAPCPRLAEWASGDCGVPCDMCLRLRDCCQKSGSRAAPRTNTATGHRRHGGLFSFDVRRRHTPLNTALALTHSCAHPSPSLSGPSFQRLAAAAPRGTLHAQFAAFFRRATRLPPPFSIAPWVAVRRRTTESQRGSKFQALSLATRFTVSKPKKRRASYNYSLVRAPCWRWRPNPRRVRPRCRRPLHVPHGCPATPTARPGHRTNRGVEQVAARGAAC